MSQLPAVCGHFFSMYCHLANITDMKSIAWFFRNDPAIPVYSNITLKQEPITNIKWHRVSCWFVVEGGMTHSPVLHGSPHMIRSNSRYGLMGGLSQLDGSVVGSPHVSSPCPMNSHVPSMTHSNLMLAQHGRQALRVKSVFQIGFTIFFYSIYCEIFCIDKHSVIFLSVCHMHVVVWMRKKLN